MSGPRRWLALSCLLAAALTGCAATPPETPAPVLTFELPATSFPDRCRGVGLDATIAGSPAVDPPVWLVTQQGNVKQLVWPAGWTARFGTELEILDRSGAVRFHSGDHVSGGCVKGPAADPGSVLMIWPLDAISAP